jgi:6-phosphogluconate dehydrogenase
VKSSEQSVLEVVLEAGKVIVFIIGGATFEEATKVAEFNINNPSLRVILGGSCVHNSTSFLKEINNTFAR